MNASHTIGEQLEQASPGLQGVYLDQSAYGHMIDGTNDDWRDSDLGKTLLQLRDLRKAEVWAGPTNVIETLQASDVVIRIKLAKMQLDLIDTRRMWWGGEYESVEDFFRFVEMAIPGGLMHKCYFTDRGKTICQLWLGALAMIAATGALSAGGVIQRLQHLKLQNRLIHARIACHPDDSIRQIVEAATSLRVSSVDPYIDIAKMSAYEIERELALISAELTRANNDTKRRLEKHRATIAGAYGGIEIGRHLESILDLPLHIELSFNAAKIVRDWEHIRRLGGGDLPREIAASVPEENMGNSEWIRDVVRCTIRAAAKIGLPVCSTPYYIILRELQQCVNAKEVPTGGLTFDADHAVAIWRFPVLIVRDTILCNSLKTLAKQCEKFTKGSWAPCVLSNADQVRHHFAM